MITNDQFAAAATIIGCDVAAIKAVYQVEAAGSAYLPDGRVKILFEGHRFWKALTKAGVDCTKYPAYSDILYPVWDKSKYKGGAAEWDRMSRAIELCNSIGVSTDLALASASYGSFQIMGENCKACGYATPHEMITAYNAGGEREQLNSFVRFIKASGLDGYLRAHNWAAFAKGYNGTGYLLNGYDTKLAAAWSKA